MAVVGVEFWLSILVINSRRSDGLLGIDDCNDLSKSEMSANLQPPPSLAWPSIVAF